MIQFHFNNIAVSGLACCSPLDSETLDKYKPIFGQETVKRFIETTGVQLRHIAKNEQTSSDLAFVAAQQLLNTHSVNAEHIGAIVFVTQTPDYRLPATAYVLQNRLGLSQNCICFDINHGCCGYVYGFSVLASLMSHSNIDYGLLLTGDTITKYISPKDKSVCMLMADAGTATLLTKSDNALPIDAVYKSDGDSFKSVIIPAGASRNIGTPNKSCLWGRDGNERSDYELFMDGMEIFSYGIRNVPSMVREYLSLQNKTLDTYDGIVMHQANLYLMKQIAKRIGVNDDNKVLVSIDRYANTSVNSIPLTIVDRYQKERKQERKKHLLLCGFGGGMSLGLVDMYIDTSCIIPMIYSNDFYTEGQISHD